MQTERQKEITQSALELIDSKGIQGLTIKNLAKKIEVSEPAIYRHYNGKIDILLAILDLFKKNTESIFETELKRKVGAMEKIEHLFSEHFKKFQDSPALVSVIFAEEIFRNEKVLVKKMAEVISRNNEIVVSIVTEGQESGEIRNDIPTAHLAVMIMGTLRLFIKRMQFAGKTDMLTAEGKELITSVKKILVRD